MISLKTVRILAGLPLLAVALWPGSTPAQEVSVPAGHPVYRFLTRLELKHRIGALPDSRPYSRMAVARLLNEAAGHPDMLTATEQGRLQRYRSEFAEERARQGDSTDTGAYWRLGSYRGQGYTLFGDYVFRQTAHDIRGGDPAVVTAYQRSSGADVWGYLGDRIGFDFYGVDTKESSSEQFSGVKQSLFGENVGYTASADSGYGIYYDKTNAHISFAAPWFTLLYGKEEQGWGPGRHGQLALADQAVPFDHMRLTARMGRVVFTSMHGKLSSPSIPGLDFAHPLYSVPDSIHKVYRDRYVAGHRIEVLWPWRIRTGVHELLFYSDRNMELAYLNPIMFYWSAEHHLNDQDNSTIGLDASINTLPNVEFYGEFFLDDLSSDSIGTGFYGNKWAVLAGCQYTDPPYLPDTDIILEYARVEPWVYTHRRAANAASNKGYPLGYWLGPNSDNLSAELRWHPTVLLDVSVFAGKSRNGENPVVNADSVINIGGDIAAGHAHGDTTRKEFLMGEREERLTLRCEVAVALPYRTLAASKYLFFLHPGRLKMSYRYSQLTNVPVDATLLVRGNRIERQLSAVFEYNFR